MHRSKFLDDSLKVFFFLQFLIELGIIHDYYLNFCYCLVCFKFSFFLNLNSLYLDLWYIYLLLYFKNSSLHLPFIYFYFFSLFIFCLFFSIFSFLSFFFHILSFFFHLTFFLFLIMTKTTITTTPPSSLNYYQHSHSTAACWVVWK